jgi:hypothetical protein
MTTDTMSYIPRFTTAQKLEVIRFENAHAPVKNVLAKAHVDLVNEIEMGEIEARRGLFEPLRMNFDGIGEQLRELNAMGQEQDESISHGY